MSTKRIRTIDILSAGYTGFTIALGLLFLGIMALIFFVSPSFLPKLAHIDDSSIILSSFEYTFVILVVYPVMGFVTGVIVASIYNLTAGFYGGLKIDLY